MHGVFQLSKEGGGPLGTTVTGEASVKLNPYFRLRVGVELDLDWGWSSPFVHRAEAKFVGQSGFGLEMSGKISGSIKKDWTKTLAKGTVPPRICLPFIWFLCIPARLRYDLNLTGEVSASASAEFKIGGRSDARVELGAAWRRGRDITPIFDWGQKFKVTEKASAEGKVTAEVKGSLTPSLIFDLPAPGLPLKLPRWRWLRRRLPDWITGESSNGRSAITLFSPKVSLPIIASRTFEFCLGPDGVNMASDEWKVGIEELVASVKIGIKEFSVDLNAKIKLGLTLGDKTEFPYCKKSTTTPPPTTTTYLGSTYPYSTTTTPYDTTTIPYNTTTTPYDTTTTPYDTTTTPYDTTTTPYDTTTTPYDTTPGFGTSDEIPCNVTDLVFLIDGSWGIGEARFEEAKIYIRNVVECLNLSEAQVGVIQFECVPWWEIKLGEYTDKIQLQNAIMADVIFKGGTPTRAGLAIRFMKATTPFRDNVRKVAVVLTDGRLGGAYAARAQEARDAGIELYGIAVGRTAFIQISGLNAITGNPGRVVHWKQTDPCMFAALLCSSG